MADDASKEKSTYEIRDEAADNFFKVAAMATGTLALLDNHGGAGLDGRLTEIWHSLRGVIDIATAYGEEISN